MIGLIGGMIVVFGITLLGQDGSGRSGGLHPGARFNGMWGTIAVGIWGQKALGLGMDGLLHGGGFTQLGIQILGTVACAVFAMAAMAIVFAAVKAINGLRVSSEEDPRSGHRRARYGSLRRLPDLHDQIREARYETDNRIYKARKAQRG
jgi:Amt family ammonium transporter